MGRQHTTTTLLLYALAVGASTAKVDDPTALKDGEDCAGLVWYPDRDADGYGDPELGVAQCDQPTPTYTRYAGDCDDTDEGVHEDAVEVADGHDNNCDGVVDEGTPLFDADQDGFCADAVGPCADPAALPGDCDDTRADTHPGAVERCDAVDNDCDGVVPASETDGDGDGFVACDDCDDGDDTRFPGATEACDGVDVNCDGAVDNVDVDGDGWVGCPLGAGRLDAVLLIDGRPQAAALRVAFADAVPRFLSSVATDGREARVLVMAADDATVLAQTSAYAPDAAQVLQTAIRGVTGAAVMPMTTLASWRAGADKPREGAAIGVFVVTRGDDGSAIRPQTLVTLLALGRTPEHVRVSAVSGGWNGCTSDDGEADPAPRIAALLSETNGVTYSVCDPAPWFVYTPRRWMPKATRDCDDTEPSSHPGMVEVCDGLDNDCDGLTDGDADLDTYTVCDGDCDDTRDTVYPTAEEVCDGLDNDCDGGLSASERDDDGDGWRTCAGDCDDARIWVYPGATEDCGDGVDANCDGADGSAADYADLDGDGWSACSGDCDDADPWAFPYAPEDKFNGTDDDCDGLVDGEDPDVVVPWVDPSSFGLMTVTGPQGWFAFCGTPMNRVSVSTEGYLLPGGGAVMDSLSSSAKMRDYAPFVAAGWNNLDPSAWGGGSLFPDYEVQSPIYVIKRPQSVSVVFDNVPYRHAEGSLSSITTLGQDHLSIHVLDALHEPTTILGWACADQGAVGIDVSEAPSCVSGGVQSAAAVVPGEDQMPVLISTTCSP